MGKAKSQSREFSGMIQGTKLFGLAFEHLALKQTLLVGLRSKKGLRYHKPGIIIPRILKHKSDALNKHNIPYNSS